MGDKKFQLLPGAWVIAPDWLNLPATVRARDPFDKAAQCRLRVSKGDVIKAAEARRRQPVYDFWSVVAGKAPPVPHHIEDGDAELTSLWSAHACFLGVRRPVGTDGDGGQFIAYVLKPTHFCVYDARPPAIMCHKRAVAEGLVFVAYARLDVPATQGAIKGVLTHWHFVEADPRDAALPIGFDERYVKRLW